ncbi:MAG: TniB family NTP-binding protein [Vulcanimicrobiaceae bacterium]
MIAKSEEMYPHLGERAKGVIHLGHAERIHFLGEPCWIGYDRAVAVLKRLRELANHPQHTRVPNLLIVGEPANGKTTIVSRFNDTDGTSHQDANGDPVRPVILAEAPPSADEKALYISILERFWMPYRASEPVVRLRYQVVHLMRTCQVRILIIDELHSVLTGTALKQREVMNALKLLCNELRIPIVGVGTRDAVRVLHTDPQHASRFDVVSLPLWKIDAEFQRLLASFERVLPLRSPSQLHAPELAKKLHFLSEGNIGNLSRLLSACARAAIESGEERITPAIVDKNAWIRSRDGIREVTL